MPSFPRPTARTTLQRIAFGASALALLAGNAAAQTTAPAAGLSIPARDRPAGAPAETETVLKRLPAGRSELTLRGENASRSFVVTLGRNEAARTTVFQMGLLSAVSLLPERSIVKVAINGTVVAAVQAASADKTSLMPIRIPAGLLVPGPNVVQVSAALTHRVDCSVNATYELWAMLDPAQTGLLVPREAAYGVHTVDDLGLEPLAEDGTTRVHLRMADDPDVADLAQAGRLVGALARRAGLQRPVVDVGPAPGTGAGFDVVIVRTTDADPMHDLRVVGRGDGFVIGRDVANNRLVLVTTAADVERLTDALGTTARSAAAQSLQHGFRKTFAELGVPPENFAGRHYTSTIDVNLPPDFLAANDRARLLIDGSHSGSLVEGSELVFRVNGTLVSSMPLAAGKSERFQHAVVELPLRFFHPGHNDLAIEGTTSAVADGQCNTATMPRDPRLTIAATSEIDFPNFAHLATMPQIPGAIAYDAAAEDATIHLYLPDTDRKSIGAGLTVLANMAVSQDRTTAPDIHIGTPSESDPPGIVVAPRGQLPEALATAVRQMTAPVADPPDALAGAAPAPAIEPDAAGEASADAAPAVLPAPSTAAAPDAEAFSVLSSAESLLRSRGFFFATKAQADLLPMTSGSLVVAAVAPQAAGTTIGGLALPQFTRDPSHWLVVTASDKAATEAGLSQLIAGGRWSALAGEAASYDPKTNVLSVMQPRTVDYVVPRRFVLSDVRPILGGIMSDNIIMSMGVLLLIMSILGLSTQALIRRSGVK